MNETVALVVSRCIDKYELTDTQLMHLLDYGGLVVRDNANTVNLQHFIRIVEEINTAPYITIRLPLEDLKEVLQDE